MRFRCLLAFVGLLLFSSCSRQSPAPTFSEVSRPRLEAYLFDAGIPLDKVFYADEKYCLASKDWVTSELATSLRQFLNDTWGGYRASQVNDCDDFARAAGFWAQVVYQRSTRNPVLALLVGEFWFRRANGGLHALNVVLAQTGGTAQLLFFEPQTGQFVTLSRVEVNSCFFCRL